MLPAGTTRIVAERGFRLGNYSDTRTVEGSFEVPETVRRNGTLWTHFCVGLQGAELDPASPAWDTEKAYHFARPLNQYLPKKKVAKTRNLLAGTDEAEEEAEEEPQPEGPIIASYYHPNTTLSVVPDSGVLNFPQMHPAPRQFVQLERTGARDASGRDGWYYPIVYLNTFWQLREHMTELNSSVMELPYHISLSNLANWKFNLYASMDDGMRQNARAAAFGQGPAGGGDGSEMEEIKRVLIDSNVYLLGTTVVVSILHTVFEMLAFKNDVSHWRKKKDNVGTSVRTILANVVMQTIIFLYLLDNNENTSWMILFGQGVGIAIEAWKITKSVNVRVRPTAPGSSWPFPYAVVFEDKHVLSETERKTEEYDQEAFKWLYVVAVPLLLAYAGYSLVYETHKSWYSFIITTLVGSVYAYGFLMMVPSLYINYRLQSVAHMPAKAMMYKFLNTFIDDLFAFTIKMPTLHRLATLRDDVIFFVYLYQSWRYKVDYTRVNEFGQGGEDEEEVEKKDKAEAKTLKEKSDMDGVEATKASGKEKSEAKKRR
ncbi:CLPTM1 domain-containing protein [Lineolata rhizophorae]|uniref:CLPTM1 domain-containing protein n=1 Tax=Lineolata rhizophorae TaxID=578093 RepID=A0A6A6NSX9_9PEZI|nr:CLPTM1 domain-containing protein [Lineolata rhizophorae]